MTVLKALKKIFGKSEAEQLAPSTSTSSHSPSSRTDGPQPGQDVPATAAQQEPVHPSPAAPQARSEKPKPEQPRRERAPKPVVIPWKLEDFAVEPQEGKTRFHDFKLSNELMHAIHDLGFPYCTPIQAQVLGHTLRGQDAICLLYTSDAADE